MTEGGTVTAALLLDSDTANPPAGAALERVTVPAEDAPPTTDVGENDMPTNVGAVTARFAVCVVDPRVPLMIAFTVAATGVVETVKLPEVWPAAIVADDGTVTPLAVLLLERAIVRPPAGAALEMLTVPAEEAPPTTVDGIIWTLTKFGADTVSGAVFVVEPSVALMIAFTVTPTVVVETVKFDEV